MYETSCCIAGAGPARVMLGFLLARHGVDVLVLEKHEDPSVTSAATRFIPPRCGSSTTWVSPRPSWSGPTRRLPGMGVTTDDGTYASADFARHRPDRGGRRRARRAVPHGRRRRVRGPRPPDRRGRRTQLAAARRGMLWFRLPSCPVTPGRPSGAWTAHPWPAPRAHRPGRLLADRLPGTRGRLRDGAGRRPFSVLSVRGEPAGAVASTGPPPDRRCRPRHVPDRRGQCARRGSARPEAARPASWPVIRRSARPRCSTCCSPHPYCRGCRHGWSGWASSPSASGRRRLSRARTEFLGRRHLPGRRPTWLVLPGLALLPLSYTGPRAHRERWRP